MAEEDHIVYALMRNPKVFESRIFVLIIDSFVIDLMNHVHIRYVHDRSILSLYEDLESVLSLGWINSFLKLICLVLLVDASLIMLS